MSREVIVSSRANADIVAAYEHYEHLVPGLGVDFIRRLDAVISLVARSPQLFRKRHRTVRLAMTERFPYAIYFVWDEASDFISIRRVLHFAQNAPAYFSA